VKEKPIIIAGGGICGLACALAAAQAGYSVLVLEKAAGFEAIGSGLQLGPNAVQALQALGAWDAVSQICRAPSSLNMHDAVSGACIRRIDLASFENRFGAPYRVAHRADLHGALLACVRAHAEITIQSNRSVVNFHDGSDGVEVLTADGSRYFGQALIATDGIHSPIRQLLWPDAKPIDAGLTFHRAPLAKSEGENGVHLWMGPHMHVVNYDVGANAQRNLVCITAQGQSPKTIAEGLAPKLRDQLHNVKSWSEWPSLYVAPLPTWSKGKCIILGDAAHGTLPFLAQGAAMALEDAAWLKAALKNKNISEAFAGHRLRLQRTAKLHLTSLRQGKIYHQSGLLAVARNTALRIMPEAVFHRQLQWIYQHRE
jgi:salicylate hydroxylase